MSFSDMYHFISLNSIDLKRREWRGKKQVVPKKIKPLKKALFNQPILHFLKKPSNIILM